MDVHVEVHVVKISLLLFGSTKDTPITIDSDLDSDSEMTPVDNSACKEPSIVVEGSPLKVLKGRKCMLYS